jgi:hypothetical protein
MDLTFTDLRQLADAVAGLCDVGGRHGFCRITGEFVKASNIPRSSGESVEGAMGTLRKQSKNPVASP